MDNLTNVVTNAEVTRSRIMDTDYAAATSELARTQIIQQAGTAMLARLISFPRLYCGFCNPNADGRRALGDSSAIPHVAKLDVAFEFANDIR